MLESMTWYSVILEYLYLHPCTDLNLSLAHGTVILASQAGEGRQQVVGRAQAG